MADGPVCTRWRRKHPKFPGVAVCVDLLGRGNVLGSLVDILCAELQANAAAHAAELIEAFEKESGARSPYPPRHHRRGQAARSAALLVDHRRW